jgi:putative transposon-encoded protein
MIIQMYNENFPDRSSKLKRRSTHHVSEITVIASEFSNSAKIIVPRGRLGKRVIAFLHSDYISKHPEERRKPDEW